MKAPFKRCRVVLEALSPIHIGSGEAVEPWQYVLEKDDYGPGLFLLDVQSLLSSLPEPDRREFLRRCDSSNPLTAREWLAERFAKLRAAGSDCTKAVVQVAPEAFKELTTHRHDANRSNEIHLFIRDEASACPYVPGSSLKGVIRTALVAAAAGKVNEATIPAPVREGRSSAPFEAMLLGHIDENKPKLDRDPLRQLAFKDLTLPENSTLIERMKVVTASGIAGDGAGTDKIQMYREITWSALDNETVKAEGELRIHHRLTDERAGQHRLPRTWDVASLCRACNGFYQAVLADEVKTFLANSRYRARLEAMRDGLKDNQCLVRIGRHSHFEAMTIPGFRQPPSRGFGKTRTYANGEMPLGWARLTLEPLP